MKKNKILKTDNEKKIVTISISKNKITLKKLLNQFKKFKTIEFELNEDIYRISKSIDIGKYRVENKTKFSYISSNCSLNFAIELNEKNGTELKYEFVNDLPQFKTLINNKPVIPNVKYDENEVIKIVDELKTQNGWY